MQRGLISLWHKGRSFITMIRSLSYHERGSVAKTHFLLCGRKDIISDNINNLLTKRRLIFCCSFYFLRFWFVWTYAVKLIHSSTLTWTSLLEGSWKQMLIMPLQYRQSQVPTRAYMEEVMEGIWRAENTECHICSESAENPVLTPSAHRVCRECLLSSWRMPTTGLCPICRTFLKKTDLITCPTENKFRVDSEKNWEESSKVSKLLECLEHIRRSGSGENNIVFSQWTYFFDLLEITLRRRGTELLRFDGKRQQKQRERVLKKFSETKEKTVCSFEEHACRAS